LLPEVAVPKTGHFMMQQTCSQSLILFVGIRPYGGSTLLGIKTAALWGSIQKTHRRVKIDLHKETTIWKTSEADVICEVETLRDTIYNRGYVRMTQHWGVFVQPLLQWNSSITYSECVFVAIGTQHARRMRHIVIYDLAGPTTFFPHYFKSGTIFEKKKRLFPL